MALPIAPTATKKQTTDIGCVDAAVRILGDKWTPSLIRSIHNSRQVRFCRLQDTVGGINPRTLTARLAGLEEQGIVAHCLSRETGKGCYQLTEKGESLVPILQSMAAFGESFSQSDDTV